MGKSEEALRLFVSKKSTFLDVPDGEEVLVRYLGAEPVETKFLGNPVASIRFHFEHDGINKDWDRTSREFAKQMMAFEEGDLLRIKRVGLRNNTKYFVTRVE